MEGIIRNRLSMRSVDQKITYFEAYQSGCWKPRDPSLMILWFVMEGPIYGFMITMVEECGFFANLINAM